MLKDIIPSDSVIVILGNPGSGKSNFINQLTGIRPEFCVRFPSIAAPVSACQFFASVRKGKRFVFIDTPPLGGSCIEAMSMELAWLYRKAIRVTGVIYTSSSNVREAIRNFQTIRNMCGEEAIDRLRLVIPTWDKVDLEYGTRLQGELQDLARKCLQSRGPLREV